MNSENVNPDPRFDDEEYNLPPYPANHLPGDYFCGCKNCQLDRYIIWKANLDVSDSDDWWNP